MSFNLFLHVGMCVFLMGCLAIPSPMSFKPTKPIVLTSIAPYQILHTHLIPLTYLNLIHGGTGINKERIGKSSPIPLSVLWMSWLTEVKP